VGAPAARAATARSAMSQDGVRVTAGAGGASSACVANAQRQIRLAQAARVLRGCGNAILSPVDRLVLAQPHVLGEPGIPADVERHEVGELRRRAAANLVIERRYLSAQRGIAQRRMWHLVPARTGGSPSPQLASSFQRAPTGSGVPAGPAKPHQARTSKPA